jgi:ADP-ribose pyrophosphatase
MAFEFGKGITHARRIVWQGSVGRFGIEDVELPDGRRFDLAVLEHPGAAAVVPFTGPDEILMLRQYRHAARGTLWEVPAGKLDPGEAPEHCAARELEEETGYRAGRLHSVGRIHTTPGFTDEVIHLFVAEELAAGEGALDPHEALVLEKVPFSKALAMAVSGEITDAKTLCALFLAERHRAGQR